MARVAAPLLSLDASGTIAKALTFSKWKGRPYVRTRVVPANPRSGLQVGMRAGIAFYPDAWNNHMAPSRKALWNAAVGSEAISGYNMFTRRSQKNLRNNHGPNTDPEDNTKTEAPAPPTNPAATPDVTDMDITWTAEPAGPHVLIFHSMTSGFGSTIATLIAIIWHGDETYTHRNPGVGTHYYDVRSGHADGGVGALAGEFSGTIV